MQTNKIVLIDDLNFENEHYLKLIPDDIRVIIIYKLGSGLFENILNLPSSCEKIIIVNFEQGIRNMEEYIKYLAGETMTEKCKIYNLPYKSGCSWNWANKHIINGVSGGNTSCYKLNKLLPKGVYDLQRINIYGEIMEDDEYIIFDNKEQILKFKWFFKED